MKFIAKFPAILLLILALAFGTCAITGCASTWDRPQDKPTMYDFIGGGKPEFNGNKY
jgi:hypothetical protein